MYRHEADAKKCGSRIHVMLCVYMYTNTQQNVYVMFLCMFMFIYITQYVYKWLMHATMRHQVQVS